MKYLKRVQEKKSLTLKVSTDVHDLLKKIKIMAKERGLKYSFSDDIEKNLLARLKCVEKELDNIMQERSINAEGGKQIELPNL